MPLNSLGGDLQEFLRANGGHLHSGNRDKLNLILDELGGLNFKKLSNEESQGLLKNLFSAMKTVPSNDATLAAKICHVLASASQPHSARLFSTEQQIQFVEEWCLRVFQTGNEMSLMQSLSALEMVLRGRAVTVSSEILTALLSENERTSLLNWLKKPKLDGLKVLPADEVKLGVLRTVKAIASPTESGILIAGNACPPARVRKLEICTTIFKQQLESNIPSNEVIYLKTTATCLRGLQSILLQRPSALGFTEGFGFVQAFWLIGLPEYDSSKFPPTPAEPGPPPPNAQSASKQGQKKGQGRMNSKQVRRMRSALVKENEDDSGAGAPRQRQPPHYIDENSWAYTSDSEDLSDSAIGHLRGSREIASAMASVRFAAIRLLLLLIKNGEPQTLMSFWDALVPYSPPGAPPPAKPGLPCCLLRDANISSKVAAAQCLGEILLRCQMYFSMAEASSGHMAFTPWSHLMAQSLESCQRYLLLSLSADRVAQCLASTLNALNSLVTVTPYHRLLPGLVTRLARSVRPFLINKHVDVKSSALSVFTALVSSSAASHQSAELQKLLEKPDPSSLFESVDNSSTNLTSEDERQEVCGMATDDLEFTEEDFSGLGKTWLLEYCLSYFQKIDAGMRLKLEICRALAAISQFNFELLLSDNGSTLLVSSNLLIQAVGDQEDDVKLQIAAGRAIVDLGCAMTKHLEEPDHSSNMKDGLSMWNNIIKNYISKLSSDQSPVVRSLVCDILSSIGPVVYENLDRSSRLVVAFTLFALCRDQATSVKIQAVRALGMCASWPIEMEDGQFLLDAADYVSNAISSEKDEILKAKVTWALGNVSDELLAKKEKGFTETLPEFLLIKLIKDSLHFCQDEKLKMNAVRSLGNLLRLLCAEQLRQPTTRELVFQAVTAITNCATSKTNSLMKVRWNSCYAMACMLRGTEMHEEVPNWQSGFFSILSDIVVSSPNFKVRLSAAVALAAPATRKHYFTFYLVAWKALLEALSSADNIQDFKEFQHRDNLISQICLSICHLASILTAEDLSGGLSGSLMLLIMAYEEQFVTQLQRVRSNLLPEKSAPITKAVAHLKELTSMQSGPALIACDHITKMLNAGQFDDLNQLC